MKSESLVLTEEHEPSLQHMEHVVVGRVGDEGQREGRDDGPSGPVRLFPPSESSSIFFSLACLLLPIPTKYTS